MGTLNVRGLGQREMLFRELMVEEKLDVLVLNEAMLGPGKKPGLGMRAAVLKKPPRRQGARSGGGTAILVRDGLEFGSEEKAFFRQTELVMIRVGGTLLGWIYIPPRAAWGGVEAAPNTFKQKARSDAILLGDLNARHETWCTGHNVGGKV